MSGFIPKSKTRELVNYFRSSPMPCPYLPGRLERKLFTRLPQGEEGARLNAELTRAGFRRSHDILYRPVCIGCRACVPARIRAGDFAISRSLRRIMKRNKDLTARIRPAQATLEQYRLFVHYQYARHYEGDMARMDMNDYAHMIEEGAEATRLIEFRDSTDELCGVMLIDLLEDGYSAVYSFYRPEDTQRSMGTYMLIWLVLAAAKRGLDHVYLGYWIEKCRKMAYKARFQPLQILTNQGWQDFSEEMGEDQP